MYEDNDAWKTAAGIAVGVAGGIAIGTLLSKPPAQAAPVTVSNNNYYYDSGSFYTKAMHEGEVVYQVVEPPAGAVVPTLPAGCTSVNKGGPAFAVRDDPLPEGGTGIRSSRRSEPSAGTLLGGTPAVLLTVVAPRRSSLTQVTMLSPWKGGGFGMFSTLDGRPFRYARMFVRAPERSEELAVPPSLEELAASVEILPGDPQLDRLARAVVAREHRRGRPPTRCGSRCGAWSSPQAR